MKIAVLGTGMVGQALAGRLDELGHEVAVGTRDVTGTMARTAPDAMGNPPYPAWAGAHPRVRLATFADAAAGAELLVNATSGGVSMAALAAAGTENLAGKVLIDIANPLDFSRGFPPSLFVKDTDSLGEQIQAAYPEAEGRQGAQHADGSADGQPGAARRRPAQRVRLRQRPGCEEDRDRPAGLVRAHRHHRPRRHQRRPRHRDADAAVAAPDGHAEHPDVQLQGRPVTAPAPGADPAPPSSGSA